MLEFLIVIKKFIKWFLSPSQKLITEDIDVYSKLIKLQQRIETLEAENIETTNTLYELMNSIDAVDARIDILTVEKWTDNNV
jgi:septal ring factor EnvC (AmiA/AmiB activator)